MLLRERIFFEREAIRKEVKRSSLAKRKGHQEGEQMERMWRERGVIAERGEGVQLHLLRERETEMVLLLWRERGAPVCALNFATTIG